MVDHRVLDAQRAVGVPVGRVAWCGDDGDLVLGLEGQQAVERHLQWIAGQVIESGIAAVRWAGG